MNVSEIVRTGIAVVLLLAATTAVLTGARVPDRLAPVVALLRAALQLAAIGVVLAGVISSPVWTGLALLLMAVVATWTVHRRLVTVPVRVLGPVLAIGAGVPCLVVFASGAVALQPRYVLAVGGIVIGNTMALTALGGRRFLESVHEQWDEVEGWLALGATQPQAVRRHTRQAIRTALQPTVDQTKTTGLVTLPGAFVGAVFGGASPLEAGRFQLLVLAAILTAGATSVTLLVLLLARRPLRHQTSP